MCPEGQVAPADHVGNNGNRHQLACSVDSLKAKLAQFEPPGSVHVF